MIGGHLRQFRQRRRRRRLAALGDAVSRFDETLRAAFLDLLLAINDELVDVALIVGEQHEALEPGRIGARIMAQPVQREIDALGGEQRKRRRPWAEPFAAVHDGVVRRVQARQGKTLRQLHALLGVHLRGALDREGQRNRRAAFADIDRRIVVVRQQRELLDQIGAEQVRGGDRRAVTARTGDLAEGEAWRTRHLAERHIDREIGIDRRLACRRVFAARKRAEALVDVGDGFVVEPHQPVEGGFGRGAEHQVGGRCVVGGGGTFVHGLTRITSRPGAGRDLGV